jgi:hypothetical protein
MGNRSKEIAEGLRVDLRVERSRLIKAPKAVKPLITYRFSQGGTACELLSRTQLE